jgi:hypothetical protein
LIVNSLCPERLSRVFLMGGDLETKGVVPQVRFWSWMLAGPSPSYTPFLQFLPFIMYYGENKRITMVRHLA